MYCELLSPDHCVKAPVAGVLQHMKTLHSSCVPAVALKDLFFFSGNLETAMRKTISVTPISSEVSLYYIWPEITLKLPEMSLNVTEGFMSRK